MKQFTEEKQFREQIKNETLSVGIFTTTWCPDCKRLDMFIDEIVDENTDKAWFKIDKDEFEELSAENNVMGIPSLLVYKNGEKLRTCTVQMLKRLKRSVNFSNSLIP